MLLYASGPVPMVTNGRGHPHPTPVRGGTGVPSTIQDDEA